MPLTEQQIKDILPEFMEYEPNSIEIYQLEIIDSNRVKAQICIHGSPRSGDEFFLNGDSSLDISFITGHSDFDNAPINTVFRTGMVIEKQDMYESPHLENFPHDMITMMLCGNLTTPEHSDDESDGDLDGSIYIEAGSSGWAEEASRKECISEIEKSVAEMMKATVNQVQSLRGLGHREPIARNTVTDLVRHCLRAA